tara:strand:+ start:465 stop:938 length:474 start_codon:yes stop_codon:yes gene_type:complete
MFEQISTFFTVEMIYLWLNFGIIPFWIILIFFPQSNFCRYFIASIIPYFILTPIYIYLFYNFYIFGFELSEIFRLYAGIDELIDLFSSSSFLILFWIHFLAINLFCGAWIVRDSQKFMVPKAMVFVPLIFTYFVGPFGILIYWIVRIFFAKKLSLYD